MPRQRRQRRALRWPVRILLIVLLCAGCVPFLVSAVARRHLHSDAFRLMVSRATSRALRVDAEYAPFQWSGGAVRSASFAGPGLPGSVKSLDLRDLQATLDLSSWRREKWDIPEVIVQTAEIAVGEKFGPSPREAATPKLERSLGFWSRWLPSGVAIQRVTVLDMAIRGPNEEWVGQESRLTLTPTPGDGGWKGLLEGGEAKIEGWPRLAVDQATFRVGRARFDLHELRARFEETAKLRVVGEWDAMASSGQATIFLNDLPAERALQPDWRRRLSGTIHAEVRLQSSANWRPAGRAWIKDGVLQALPVLDSMADYTRTAKFRRLPLTEAASRFEVRADHLALEDFILASEGLLKVSGRMVIQTTSAPWASRPMAGAFQVGVAPEVLKWLPGAADKVFTETRAGYRWTEMRVAGTLADPREDLTPRLKEAAIAAGIEAVPETVLRTGETVVDEAGQLIERARQGTPDTLIDAARSLLERGQRFVPMLDVIR